MVEQALSRSISTQRTGLSTVRSAPKWGEWGYLPYMAVFGRVEHGFGSLNLAYCQPVCAHNLKIAVLNSLYEYRKIHLAPHACNLKIVALKPRNIVYLKETE